MAHNGVSGLIELAVGKIRSVEAYIEGLAYWQPEVVRLRSMLLSLPSLQETVKWGAPTYVAHGKNIVGIAAFRDYFGLWFFQGSLLADQSKHLRNAQEGKTKAMRQWRFTSADQLADEVILQYVGQAIDLASQGKEIKPQRSKRLEIPRELQEGLADDATASACFSKLTLGRQREFADYIAQAKQAQTKARRLEKILPMIAAGQGLNDKYRR